MKRPDHLQNDSLERLDRIAGMLDTRFKVPGTNWRFGFDAIIGLFPGAGDLVTTGLSAYILWKARQMGASRTAQSKMAAILLIDAAVGSIPFVGDIFDAAWKANRRNLDILRKDLHRGLKRLPTDPEAQIIKNGRTHLD